MDQLRRAQRQSVALAFYDGLSHAEVADADAPAARHRQVVGAARAAGARRAASSSLARAAPAPGGEAEPDGLQPPRTRRSPRRRIRCGHAARPARRRFEALLPAHPQLRAATPRMAGPPDAADRRRSRRSQPPARGLAAHRSAHRRPQRRHGSHAPVAAGGAARVLARPGRIRQRRGGRPRGAARDAGAGAAADRRRAVAHRPARTGGVQPAASSPASAPTAARW